MKATNNLKKLTEALGESTRSEEINTNNAWGFGGWSGVRHYFPGGFLLEEGKASTRHCGTSPIKRVRLEESPHAKFTVEAFLKLWKSGLRAPEEFEKEWSRVMRA